MSIVKMNCTVWWREWVGNRKWGGWRENTLEGGRVEISNGVAIIFNQHGTAEARVKYPSKNLLIAENENETTT